MIMFTFLFIGFIGCVLCFTEETKIGKKLADKMYDYFMEN